MIVKTNKGFQVVSHKGKPLSAPNLSEDDAKKRLAEIEYFKHQAGDKS